jgi:trans-aconitate 2-methyltransferase
MSTKDWNSSLYDQKHAFVFEYGKSLLSLLDPQPGESILDLGCGTGHLTKAIAESGAHVVGLDSSPSMIEVARAAYPELEFILADATNFSLPATFDAVFSNATLHWVIEAEKAIRCIATSLKTGGRLVAEFGGKGNVATIITAIQQSIWELVHIEVNHGWYYPSIGEYTPMLEKHGLAVQSAILFDRPTKLEDGENGLRNWIHMFCASMFRDVPDAMKEQVLHSTEEKVRDRLFMVDHWIADYRRLRIMAAKE